MILFAPIAFEFCDIPPYRVTSVSVNMSVIDICTCTCDSYNIRNSPHGEYKYIAIKAMIDYHLYNMFIIIIFSSIFFSSPFFSNLNLSLSFYLPDFLTLLLPSSTHYHPSVPYLYRTNMHTYTPTYT